MEHYYQFGSSLSVLSSPHIFPFAPGLHYTELCVYHSLVSLWFCHICIFNQYVAWFCMLFEFYINEIKAIYINEVKQMYYSRAFLFHSTLCCRNSPMLLHVAIVYFHCIWRNIPQFMYIVFCFRHLDYFMCLLVYTERVCVLISTTLKGSYQYYYGNYCGNYSGIT